MFGAFLLLYFETDMSINTQVGYYLSSRVVEGIALKLMKEKYIPNVENGFSMSYTLIWGLVMFLFELDAKILNRSLSSSMVFLYKNSDQPLKNMTDLIPFDMPNFIIKKL